MAPRNALRIALVTYALGAHALSDCDNEAGQVCPMSAGKEIGECLQDPAKHQLTDIDGNPREREADEKPLELSDACKAFIKINVACDADIAEHCSSNYYHSDTMICLTQWTSQDKLGSGCVAALPKKEEEEETVDKDKEAWRAKRKAAREASMKQMKAEKGGDSKKSKRRRRRGKQSGDEDL
eukprot:TRINITY_DN16518_c0_g1_i1.p1 TRINITY_DN16518_c0_g1~~TRINITY_DN16518_c0_g1_i1.p1  ORF type:complete len:182 (-),score=56.44 TRINITY_DN16518_c0_g1_i1:103-648(-)